MLGWLFFSALGTAWTLYYCRDILGGGSPAGVCVLKIYVDASDDYDDERAVRCIRTWLLLNKAPLIVFAATCWVGLIYTFLDASQSFNRHDGWPPAISFAPTLLVLGVSAVSLLFALGRERQSLFDRLLRVRVIRPTFLQDRGMRGFAVATGTAPLAVGERAASEYPPATR